MKKTNVSKGFFLAFVIILISITTGCAKKEEVISPIIEEIKKVEVLPKEEKPTVPKEELAPIIEEPILENLSPFTGLPIDEELINRRPIGITISNIKAALPQSGIYSADIMYETLVEGGITRLMFIYHDFSDEKIGPIRSARHYYLDFSLDNDAIYTHVGQSTYATDAFKKLPVERFYGISRIETLFSYRDTSRKAPHNTYTGYTMLMNTWDELEYRKELIPESRKFHFNSIDTPFENGESLTRIELDYSPYITVTMKYNAETGLYERFQYGEKHIDVSNNKQLEFKNVIVQYTDIWQIKGDKLGCMDMALIAKGTGLLISQGKKVAITWEKVSHESPTMYYFEDGTPITLNPGKTFISVFPSKRIEKILMEGSND